MEATAKPQGMFEYSKRIWIFVCIATAFMSQAKLPVFVVFALTTASIFPILYLVVKKNAGLNVMLAFFLGWALMLPPLLIGWAVSQSIFGDIRRAMMPSEETFREPAVGWILVLVTIIYVVILNSRDQRVSQIAREKQFKRFADPVGGLENWEHVSHYGDWRGADGIAVSLNERKLYLNTDDKHKVYSFDDVRGFKTFAKINGVDKEGGLIIYVRDIEFPEWKMYVGNEQSSRWFEILSQCTERR